MEFRILLFGPVELRVGDGRSGLGSGKGGRVLAALAWDAGRSVPVDTLIRRVWDDDPPERAHASLYTYVSRIRRTVRDLGRPGAPPLTG
ncbi:MAG TPA: winged helix-turn-helix domain-containing protein, partial [Streptomyces sp.]|uniref:AfsR/SARP family transcriptional regulator n=1 Tax=Streptomyces sp. TaxID=1931 RepID=UPI002D5269AF